VSERDPVVTLLRELDGPADPRTEFADALRARLLEELAQTDDAPARQRRRPLRPGLPARLRRPLLAGALALAVAAIVIATVVVSRPSPASALDVIRQARIAFAHMPPFQATYKVELNPDGTGPSYVKKGATATVVLSYGGPNRVRTQILAGHGFTSDLFKGAPGSYQIYNGRSMGVYDAKRHHFFALATSGIPFDFLSWHGHPDWERDCRGPNSKVLADARIAGRDARHVRCGDFQGDVWELWIDSQTGLLLKIVGQVGGDNFFLGGDIGTSAKGGFEIQKLRYNPTFPPRTFSFPPGTYDPAAALQAILRKLPPFRAVIVTHQHLPRGLISYVDEVWWQNEHTWRSNTILAAHRGCCGANYTGGFTVAAHGTTSDYNAHDKTFTRESSPGDDSAFGLLDYLKNQDISPARCPIVGHARIAGRETDHHRCARYVASATAHRKNWATWEYWTDPATGLPLSLRINGHDLVRVRSIQYRPHFPPGIFQFVPPRGSHNLYKLEDNPYYKTKLARGKLAANWRATTLAGRPFQLSELRGKPALLLLLPDWCSCNEFLPLSGLAPLEQAYRHSNGATTVIWVDAQGTAKAAKTLARFERLTFPVVVDNGAVKKAWAPQGFPKWVLLDSHGRVIDVRIGPQTVAQLGQLLGRG
jgi:redoxin